MLKIDQLKNKNILIIGNACSGKTTLINKIKTENSIVFDNYTRKNNDDLSLFLKNKSRCSCKCNCKKQLIVSCESVEELPEYIEGCLQREYFEYIFVFKQNNNVKYNQKNMDYVYKCSKMDYDRDRITEFCEKLREYEFDIFENDLDTYGHFTYKIEEFK